MCISKARRVQTMAMSISTSLSMSTTSGCSCMSASGSGAPSSSALPARRVHQRTHTSATLHLHRYIHATPAASTRQFFPLVDASKCRKTNPHGSNFHEDARRRPPDGSSGRCKATMCDVTSTDRSHRRSVSSYGVRGTQAAEFSDQTPAPT